jgi:hypothetical protein
MSIHRAPPRPRRRRPRGLIWTALGGCGRAERRRGRERRRGVHKPLAAGHFATPGRRHDSTSEPAAAEFGGGGTCGGVPSAPVRACLFCQRGKVHKHGHLQPAEIPVPHRRFAHIHVDLVGPLPPSQGHTYLFTIIDRTSR